MRSILVNCKSCGEKIDKLLAFNVIVNGKNNYYCSEVEYKEIKAKQIIKDNVYNEINCIFGRKITNTILYKEITGLTEIYTYKKLLAYLKENNDYLSDVMTKDFINEYAQIRYFTAILKNSLNDFIEEVENNQPDLIIDIPHDNYKAKERRKPLIYFEQDGDDI